MQKVTLYEHKVQYYETDQMAIVHHSNYIRWFEEARNFMMEEVGFSYQKMEECGIIVPVLDVSAKYKTMTHFGDTVCIQMKTEFYNGTRLKISYTIFDKETKEIRCIGSSSHCFLSKTGNLVSLKRSYPEIHRVFEEMKSLS